MGGMQPDAQQGGGVKEIYCANCSKKHLTTERFCPHCGSEYNPCPKCGADNPKNARRCVSCGHHYSRLRWEERPAIPAEPNLLLVQPSVHIAVLHKLSAHQATYVQDVVQIFHLHHGSVLSVAKKYNYSLLKSL